MPAETVYNVLIRAQRIAAERSHGAVAASHLTLALLDCDAENRVWQLLNGSGIKRDEMRLYVEAALDAAEIKKQTGAQPRPFAEVGAMLRDASKQAHDTNEAENQNALLLIALAAQRSINGETLRSLGLEPGEMRLQLRHLTRAAAPNGNPLKLLDADAQNALDGAHQIMRATGCGRISTAHLLLGILENREVYVLKCLADNGIDLDELAHLTRATISSDGQIATAQLRLAPAAKRALDRARDVVPSRTRRKSISPQALLWGLLPRPITLRERLAWGEPDDALERVWRRVEVAPIERILSVLLGVEIIERDQRIPTGIQPIGGWVLAGAAWASSCGYFIWSGYDLAAPGLFAGFGVALLLDWAGRWKKSYALRAIALSLIAGCVLAILMGALGLAFFGTLSRIVAD